MYRRLIGKLVLIVPVSLLAICGSLGQTSQIKESYLPLAKGNQWCYRDSQSVWPDGHVEIDTTIVNADSTEIIDGSEYFFFRSGFPMYVDSATNDTIERMLARLDDRGNLVVFQDGRDNDVFHFDSDQAWSISLEGAEARARVTYRDSVWEFHIGRCRDCVTIQADDRIISNLEFWTFCRGIGLVRHSWIFENYFDGETTLLNYSVGKK